MDSCTASTICPNPSEGVYKYTVVTTGRPVVDGLHHGDLPVPADFLRKQGVVEARLGKRHPGSSRVSATTGLPHVKARDLKVHSFKKPSIQPLDPTEMSDYSPRTTTFVNGRPSSVSTPKHHAAFSPASAATGPSHRSPDSVRDGSATTRDDVEDAASVDSAPGSMRLLNPRVKDISIPDSVSVPRFACGRYPQDLSTTDESLDLYLEQFFPELHSMSDAELLRLMDPSPAATPAFPTRASTLAILQDMLLTQGSYAGSASVLPAPLKQHPSTASNPPSNNWSSMASDEHNSHNWSEAPSQSWRPPRSPSPGPANWMSWPSVTQTRKRQRPLDSADELEWPTLAEHMPSLSGELPTPSKRQMLQRAAPAQQQGGDHEAVSSLDRQLLFSVPSGAPQGHEPRPNPFASVSKLSLMQQAPLAVPRTRGFELPSYLSMQSSVSLAGPPQRGFACSPTLASPDSSSRSSSLDTTEPASALEQALRDLRSKPEAQAC